MRYAQAYTAANKIIANSAMNPYTSRNNSIGKCHHALHTAAPSLFLKKMVKRKHPTVQSLVRRRQSSVTVPRNRN